MRRVGTVVTVTAGAVLALSACGNQPVELGQRQDAVEFHQTTRATLAVRPGGTVGEGGCKTTGDNKVYCWGSGSLKGAVETGWGTDPYLVTMGDGHTCTVGSDSYVYCWGRNLQGQCGQGNFTDPAPKTAIDASYGTRRLVAGQNHTCSLTRDGLVKCWGLNQNGQLGDGQSGTMRNTPALTTAFGTAVDITAGEAHTCALTDNGNIFCWGANNRGQLGDGTTTPRPSPKQVPLVNRAIAVSAGANHTCAITAGGILTCWGDNQGWQLGLPSRTSDPFYKWCDASVPLSGVSAVSAGKLHTCALTQTGLYCWGSNYHGEIGDGFSGPTLRNAEPTPMTSLTTGFVEIRAGANHTCVLGVNGVTYCWGANGNGGMADGTQTDSVVPVAITGISAGSSARAVAAGDRHTCAIASDGALKCWGNGLNGRLADNNTTDHTVPTAVANTYLTSAKVVVAGSAYSCALTKDEKAKCWGANDRGQLGTGNWAETGTPTDVSTSYKFVELAGGSAHVCGITAGRALFCWGGNNKGQLGNGNKYDRCAPNPGSVPVLSGYGYVRVAAGKEHTCAISDDGTVACWGSGGFGELGSGTVDKTAPIAVPGVSGAIDIAAGDGFTCVVKSNSQVVCWGKNDRGQMARPSETLTTSVPPTVAFSGAVAITANGDHACSVNPMGTMQCWGGNLYDYQDGYLLTPLDRYYALGANSTVAFSATPLAQLNMSNMVVSASIGRHHGCAIRRDGTARCWGADRFGQLGDNNAYATPLPPGGANQTVAVSGY